jgi:hypothetical protein
MANAHRNFFPWIFGSFAIYAGSAQAAQQVYDRLKDGAGWVEPFGTSATDDGEEVAWVNTRYITGDLPRKMSH